MSARDIVLGAASGGAAATPTYVDDVFSTYLYTGNGATQTITNGIDLAGKGGLVWVKCRGAAFSNCLVDTVRGANQTLFSDSTVVNQNYSGSGTINTFSSTGFNVGTNAITNATLAQGGTFAAWTFRKAPKFFDIVTYTGDGQTYKQIQHSLGCNIGMLIIKRTDNISNWNVIARVSPTLATGPLALNTAGLPIFGNANIFFGNSLGINDANTYFNASRQSDMLGNSSFNDSGASYVAYVFAHNTAADSMIKCGSYTGNGSSQTINCGFAAGARFILIKRTNAAGDWFVWDTARGIVSGNDPHLSFNTEISEVTTDDSIDPDSTGFIVNQVAATNINVTSATYIFLAIA